jgi:hypothetical protein
MNITLQRTSMSDTCTEGNIVLPDGTTVHSLELPWVPEQGFPGGEPDKSCVPSGLYTLALHDTLKHPFTFALVNPALGVIHEPDPTFPNARTACLIHVANTVADLEGCIGIGMTHLTCFVGASVLAMTNFKTTVPWVAGNTLTITDP